MPALTTAGALRWLFADRVTGRFVIGQWPNLPLWLFAAAWLGERLLPLPTEAAFWLRFVADGALLVWAVDEILRGVNPWRRILGASVLTGLAISRLL